MTKPFNIVAKCHDQNSATFDREALTLMLLQLDDPNIEPPTLQAFLQRIMDELPTEPAAEYCPECEAIRQIIRKQRQ